QDDNSSDNENDGEQEDEEKLFATRGAMKMGTATNKSINTIRKLRAVSCSKEGDTKKNDTNNGINTNNNNNNKEALHDLVKSKAKVIESQKKSEEEEKRQRIETEIWASVKKRTEEDKQEKLIGLVDGTTLNSSNGEDIINQTPKYFMSLCGNESSSTSPFSRILGALTVGVKVLNDAINNAAATSSSLGTKSPLKKHKLEPSGTTAVAPTTTTAPRANSQGTERFVIFRDGDSYL
ncbi:MAG: hypothetical protein ACI8RD_012650, partial [Bacillariaceae sp.]